MLFCMLSFLLLNFCTAVKTDATLKRYHCTTPSVNLSANVTLDDDDVPVWVHQMNHKYPIGSRVGCDYGAVVYGYVQRINWNFHYLPFKNTDFELGM